MQEDDGGVKRFSRAHSVLQTNYIKLLGVGPGHPGGSSVQPLLENIVPEAAILLSTKVLEFLSLITPPGSLYRRFICPC